MAEDKPIIRILGFRTAFEHLPVKGDPLNDDVDAKGYKIDKHGRRVMEHQETDWVMYAPAHSPLATQTEERIRHLKPSEADQNSSDADRGEKYLYMAARWSQIEPAYLAWKAGNTIPVDGTPLATWAGITQAQADVLRGVGIRTVEDVSNLTDGQIERIRLPNMRDMRQTAKLFLDGLVNAQHSKREADLLAERDAMLERMAAMEALLEQVTMPAKKPVDELAALRAELDAQGIAYHHKAGVDTLKALLNKDAA